MNLFVFCDADPIKKPLISYILFNLSIFLEFTDPPYSIIGFFDLNFFFINFLILIKLFLKSFIFGIMPVPIHQTGSYAKMILFKFFIFFKPSFICFFKTILVFFSFFHLKFRLYKKLLLIFGLVRSKFFY